MLCIMVRSLICLINAAQFPPCLAEGSSFCYLEKKNLFALNDGFSCEGPGLTLVQRELNCGTSFDFKGR